MSQFTDKHTSDLTLQTSAIIKQIRDTQPTLADAFEKRIRDDIERPVAMAVEKTESIRSSGRLTPEGDRIERRLNAHGTMERLAKVRTATVDKIEAQRLAREAALLAPKDTAKDPALALVHELRLQEVRRDLRALDPLTLQVRLKQAATSEHGTLLLEAIESDPIAAAGGAPIASTDALREARAAMALAADPQLGELALLRDAYQFCLGAAEQVVLAASGLTKLEVMTADQTPAADDRKPYLVSTGKEVPA
jgi:hypothetical protein